MSRLAGHIAALALGAAAVLALASCGGGGEESHLLPGETAQQITENVASVRDLAAAGECVSAKDAAQEVGNQVEALSGIDAKLKQALENGAAKLNEVVLTCDEEPEEEELEEAEPPEEEETPKKPAKPKPGKEKEAEPPAHQQEPEEVPKNEQTPPKGEAKGHEEAPAPPEPTEPPSGGIGPGSEAGGQG